MSTIQLKPIEDYLNENVAAVRQNPPPAWVDYKNDPVKTWKYVLNMLADGLADYPDQDIYQIQGNIFGSLIVAPCLKCQVMVPMSNKEVINTLWGRIKTRRARR